MHLECELLVEALPLGDERGVPNSTARDNYVWHAHEDQEEINQEYVKNLKASKICMGFATTSYGTCAQEIKDPREHTDYAGRVKLEKAPKRTSGVSFGDDGVNYESIMKSTFNWIDIKPPQ